MNYLKGKSVYLCGPIHAVSDDGVGWRERIKPKLEDLSIEILDPCKKTIDNLGEVGDDKKKFRELIEKESWEEVKEKFWPIIRFDLRCCDKVDFLIFNYNPNVPMVGSVHELVVANFEKKVILLKYEKSQLKDFNPWICTFIKSHHFFSEWDKLFEYLDQVNNGKLDTSLWVL